MEKIERSESREIEKGAVRFEIALTRRNYEDIDLDGDICTTANYHESLAIEIYRNGKQYARAYDRPSLITAESRKTYDRSAPDNAYSHLADGCYLSPDTYREINNVIDEMYAATDAPEIVAAQQAAQEKAEKESAEDAIESKVQKQQRKSGMCPKCGTWCYGDCEAN